MMFQNHYASQIIQSYPEPPGPPVDVWDFHSLEPRYRRELESYEALKAYALSPSTREMRLFPGDAGSLGEFRVFGPGDREVWLCLKPWSFPLSPEDLLYWRKLRALYLTLWERGKVE